MKYTCGVCFGSYQSQEDLKTHQANRNHQCVDEWFTSKSKHKRRRTHRYDDTSSASVLLPTPQILPEIDILPEINTLPEIDILPEIQQQHRLERQRVGLASDHAGALALFLPRHGGAFVLCDLQGGLYKDGAIPHGPSAALSRPSVWADRPGPAWHQHVLCSPPMQRVL